MCPCVISPVTCFLSTPFLFLSFVPIPISILLCFNRRVNTVLAEKSQPQKQNSFRFLWLAFLLSFRSDSDPHLDSAYATSQYCFLFFQHKFCLILCRAVASDEDFESTVFTFYTLIFCQEAKLFFCDFEDDFGFFSRLKVTLQKSFSSFTGRTTDAATSWM